jgi:hypothetical protein
MIITTTTTTLKRTISNLFLKSQRRFVLVKYRDGLLMRVPEDSNIVSFKEDKEDKFSLINLLKMYQLYTQQKKSLEVLNNSYSTLNNGSVGDSLTLNQLAKHGLLKYSELRKEMLRGNCDYVENNSSSLLIDKFIKDYRNGFYNEECNFKLKELYDLKLKKFEYQFQDGVGLGQLQIEFISNSEIRLPEGEGKEVIREKMLCHRVNLFLNPSSHSTTSTTTSTSKKFMDEDGNHVLEWKVSSITPFNDKISWYKMNYYKIRFTLKESVNTIRKYVMSLTTRRKNK